MGRRRVGLVFGVWVFVLLVVVFGLVMNVPLVKGSGAPRTWTVDDDGPADFRAIQQAIQAANSGDLIRVAAGKYYENLIIDKPLTLQGEDKTAIIDGRGYGTIIRIFRTNHVSVGGFTIQNGIDGISVVYSYNVTLRNNNIKGNWRNFDVWGKQLSHFVHDIDNSNTVDEKLLYYWVNRKNEQVPFDAGYVAVINSTNIKVKNLILTKNGQGVLFAFTNNSRIENIDTTKNVYGFQGVYMYKSNKNIIAGSRIGNNFDGVRLEFSQNNKILNNNITFNKYNGVTLVFSRKNILKYNTLMDNHLMSIYIGNSDRNKIDNNAISNNGNGI